MDVYSYLHVELGQIVGIDFLETGRFGGDDGKIKRLDWFWFAELIIALPYKSYCFVVASIKWDLQHQGILLIPENGQKITPQNRNYVGMETPFAINLKEWDDPVYKSLEQLDVVPKDRHAQSSIQGTWLLDLFVMSGASETRFKYSGFPKKDKKVQELWMTTIDAIRYFDELYNQPEMHTFTDGLYKTVLWGQSLI